MVKEFQVLKKGNVYFFSRPKVENQAEVQRFFLVLHPNEHYYLLIIGKKHLPTEKEGSYFAFVEAIKKNKNDLLQSLKEKTYQTATRGERILPSARCLGAGKFLLVEHHNHTHFIYHLTAPSTIKPVQAEFNLQKEDDYLISVKNPQVSSASGVGLTSAKKATYPEQLQAKLANYRFAPLNPSNFLDYEGTELLLIPKKQPSLSQREKELENCWKEINSENLVAEFAKMTSPETIVPIEK
jgi:hypothetical protein